MLTSWYNKFTFFKCLAKFKLRYNKFINNRPNICVMFWHKFSGFQKPLSKEEIPAREMTASGSMAWPDSSMNTWLKWPWGKFADAILYRFYTTLCYVLSFKLKEWIFKLKHFKLIGVLNSKAFYVSQILNICVWHKYLKLSVYKYR